MSDSPYLQQIEQRILSMLAEKKYADAYKMCKDLAEKYPGEGTIEKMKNEVEEAVEEENNRLIESKMKLFDQLFKEKKYADILLEVRILLNASPKNSLLIKTYKKAANAYESQEKEQNKEAYKTKSKILKDLFKNNSEAIVDELFAIEKKYGRSELMMKLVQDFRNKYIHRKIKEKEDLIYSEKYEDTLHLIYHLDRIDPKNEELKQLKTIIKKRAYGSQVEQAKDFVFAGETYLDTLMRLKKYDKAIQLAQEIIQLDKKNTKVQKILNKAEKKYFKITKNKAIDSIYKELPNLKKERNENKKQFIRIF